MKILQITKKFPWPVKDGEVIGIFNLTSGFAQQGHEVTVLCLNTQKHYFPPNKLPASVRQLANFISVDIDTGINPWDAFLNLFTSRSYNIERFYSPDFEAKIGEICAAGNFDIILLEGIYLMRYIDVIRQHTGKRVVLRPQNVEFVIWQRLFEIETNPLKKIYLQLLVRRMKRFELEMMNRADVLIPVSETDLQIFLQYGCTIPHIAIPTGYVFESLPAISADEENAAAFIGGMDWIPNREGVEWFLEKVWPLVINQIPEAKFYLAGRNFPPEIKTLRIKGLVIVGEVEDAQKYILSKSIFIVPLFAGSGMRVKIVEAMALGRAVISTTVGAESLGYTDGKDILIADEPHSFAGAIINLMKDKALRMDLGLNAQRLIETKYDNRKICTAIIDFCKSHIS